MDEKQKANDGGLDVPDLFVMEHSKQSLPVSGEYSLTNMDELLTPEQVLELKSNFARMFLDNEAKYTKYEICRALGISTEVYNAWADDEDVLATVEIESWRQEMMLARKAFEMQEDILSVIAEIAYNPKASDIARVQAVRALSEIASSLRERTPVRMNADALNKAEAERQERAMQALEDIKSLVTNHKPVFVDGRVVSSDSDI